MSPRRLVHLLALVWALLSPPASLRAGEDATDPAMAQSLFEAGRAMMAEGKTQAACAKFEESNRLDPSAGTLLNLGKCYEALGRTATAWATYKRAIGVGRSTGQTRHVSAAEAFIEELEPRLSKLLVSVPTPQAGLRLWRGDTEIAAAARDVALAVDPGTYVIRAAAAGYQPWERTVVVEAGASAVTVVVPPLVEQPRDEALRGGSAPAPGPRPDLLIAAGLVGAAGVVTLGVGAGFGAATLSSAADARDDPSLCPADRCTSAGWAEIEGARTSATISTVTLAVGGVAAATGVTLLALAFALPPTAPELALRPALAPDLVGLWIGGAL